MRHEVESALHHGNALDLSVRTLDGQVRYTGLQALRLLLQDEILHLLAAEPQTCKQAEGTRVHLIPLHRIDAAAARYRLHELAIEPDIAQAHALGIREGMRLKLRVSRALAESLLDRPIGSGQTLSPCTQHPERYIVCTDIDDGPRLRSWLAHRLPSELEILEPAGFPEHAA